MEQKCIDMEERIDIVMRYVKEIDKIEDTGIGTEQSYYPAVRRLVNDIGRYNVYTVPEPRTRDGNRPDFVVHAANMDTIGIIEAKKLGSDLDKAVNSEQLKRYLGVYPNFILTNFREFRVYRKGMLIQTVDLDDGEYDMLQHESLVNMFDRFLAKRISAEADVCHIAELLAGIARDELKPAICDMFVKDIDDYERDDSSIGNLLGMKADFEANVTGAIKAKDFVDMCAQTITYGLLNAKINHCDTKCEFDRLTAKDDIPDSFEILHALFEFIVVDSSSAEIDAAIERIVDMLNSRDIADVMKRYYIKNRGKDWFTHFYETFLMHYDPAERKRRGSFYTPYHIVSYINRSVHLLLKNSFDKELGFADESVSVLDPAVGTMAFLADTWQLAIDEKVAADGFDERDVFIKDHIMEHFHGNEVMMTPFVLSLLRTKAFFDKIGYYFPIDKSNVYLANTLDLGRCSRRGGEQTTFYTDVGKAINKEHKRACKAHLDKSVIAIIGNPPYSAESANKGMFDEELELYKAGVKIDKDGLKKERNIKLLSDDYIKFMRFAHKKVVDRGSGMIGYITNHSYLGGVIHRGMREELMKSFDEIYILNLHGNTRNPIAGDKGVFGITVGTAIAIFVKTSDNPECNVYYSDLIGSRESKFDYLDANDVNTTEWQELDSCAPYYFFEPKDFFAQDDYDMFVSVSDVFKETSSGVKTARDCMTIQKTSGIMWEVVNDFCDMDIEPARQKYKLRDDTTFWKVELAQDDVERVGRNHDLIKPISYRPFDTRYTYYTGKGRGFMESPRKNIMKHMVDGNIGMLFCRQFTKNVFNHIYVCDNISDIHTVSGQTYMSPLYLYTNNTRTSNINPTITTALTTTYNTTPTPEDIFYYIYGILYSNPYREKYMEFLKINFPKIPFTNDYELFMRIGEIGKKLVELHLMKPEVFDKGSMKCRGSGDNIVRKATYDDDSKRVEINNAMYFEPVSRDVWEYQIGGYIPAKKWLTDRKGDALTWDDIDHYMGICAALRATIELQAELGVLYADVESGEVLNFDTRKDSTLSEY